MITILNKLHLLRGLNSNNANITYNISMKLRQICTSNDDEPKFDMQNPYEKDKVECILCKMNITPDYKNVKLLSQFQSPFTGRIYGKHITGLCTHKQKQVEIEIIKAQNSGLMGYYNKDPAFMKDPKLFDPENPIKSHRF